jgi:hypothetical protein
VEGSAAQMAWATAEGTWWHEERPWGRARAESRARAAPGSEGGKRAALQWSETEERRRRRKNRRAEGLPEEEEGWRDAKDLIANYKNFKGLKVKLNFPLLQGSNGKMAKIEKWPKYKVLQHCFRV